MAGDAERRVLARADHRPGAIVEVEVEVGQHDRAFRRARDRRDEAGGGAIGAGRAGDDGWPAPRAVERLDLFVDGERDPLRPVDEAALAQPLRPTGEGDLEEIEGDAPIGVIKIGRERFELRPWRALDDHVVDQRREIAGEPVSLRRGRRDQRGLGGVENEAPVRVRPSDRALERLSPGAGEGGERMAAREPADRRGDRRPRGVLALGVEDRRRLVRLEGAERRDARQEQAPCAARREQRLGQRLGRALRRHIDRGVGERHRPARAGEALDQRAVQKSAAQGRQKRGPGGNREDSRRAMAHARLLERGSRKREAGFSRKSARNQRNNKAPGASTERFMRRAREGKRVSHEELWPAFPTRSRRPASRIEAGPARRRRGGPVFRLRAAARRRRARHHGPPAERGAFRR